MIHRWKIALLVAILTGAASRAQQVLPHIAVGGNFTTEFLIINTGTTAGTATISFFDDAGSPMNVNLPDLNSRATGIQTFAIAPGGSVVAVANDPNGSVRGGSAVVTATSANIVVQAIFRSKGGDGNFYEAAVPATSGSARFAMPFDATTFRETGVPIYTGIAITNVSSTRVATVTCTTKDSSGATIQGAVYIQPLQPRGHWSGYFFPALTGKRGTLDCSADTTVAAIGLRFLGSSAFSSLMVVQSAVRQPDPPPGTQPVPSRVVGNWANQITQTTVDNIAVPPRTYAVTLRFLPDGTYSYGVTQSRSPAWQMTVTGRYTVSAAPPNNQLATTQVVMTPGNVSITGITDTATRTSELFRLAFEGFPGTTNETFLVSWDVVGAMHMKNANTIYHSCTLLQN
jgi:hypothetical protein